MLQQIILLMKMEDLKITEQKINYIRAQKNEMERKLGRIEGILESRENKVKISGRCPLCGNEVKEIETHMVVLRELTND